MRNYLCRHVYLMGNFSGVMQSSHSLPGYSAHADQKGLLEWVRSMSDKPKEIKLVHGESDAQQALAEALEDKGYNVLHSKY